MYHESTVVPHPENTVRAYLSGGEIPVIAISDGEHSTNQLKIQLPSTVGSEAQVDWLRSLAGQLEDLAEQIEIQATYDAPVPTGTEYDLYADKAVGGGER